MWYETDAIYERARAARRWVAITGGLAAAALVARLVGGSDLTWVSVLFWIASYIAFIVAGFAWIGWFRAVYDQVEARRRARFAEPWPWLGWVLPFANLVLPKMMVNDVWRAPALLTDPPAQVPAGKAPAAVQAWWVLWFMSMGGQTDVLGNVVGSVALALCTPFAIRTITILTERAVALAEWPAPAETMVPS